MRSESSDVVASGSKSDPLQRLDDPFEPPLLRPRELVLGSPLGRKPCLRGEEGPGFLGPKAKAALGDALPRDLSEARTQLFEVHLRGARQLDSALGPFEERRRH